MMNSLWRRIYMLGLKDDQEFSHREVVLLNKLAFIAGISMIPVMPLEIALNNSQLLAYEFLIMLICGIVLVLSHFKLFTLAKIYFFFSSTIFILIMGTAVGEGTGNYLFLIPVFIAPSMLLHKNWLIILLSAVAFIAFLLLPVLQDQFPPYFDIDPSMIERFNYVFISITFLIIFFQIYYFKDINQRFQSLLSSKNELIEEKNKEIVDSINYAQRIQQSYLPSQSLLQHFFPESFLFFEPKDIVSGDFYWFYAGHKDDSKSKISDEIFIVAADSTGHGVPGAIMSVICANALNEVIVNQKERDTGKIFDQVRERIVSLLKTQSGDHRKDGMDAVICKINKKTGEVMYSGAHNPLWILRKDSDSIEVIKGDRQPVGAFQGAHPFTTHSLQLQKGDQIYFFSDGYQDQFGGDKGKKFKAANMKRIILENKTLMMPDQKEVLRKKFFDWKGDLEQVDDVVMIGIQL